MTTMTIPKQITGGEELVIIPRKEYEKFLRFQLKKSKEVELTSLQKKMLKKARENLARGKFLTIYELKQKLGIKD